LADHYVASIGEGRLLRDCNGAKLGMPARSFLALRNNGARYHVGVDLFANEGDEVVACEDGQIGAFYRFYQVQGTGQWSCALLIEHSRFVINYGEVSENSLALYGLKWETRCARVRKSDAFAGPRCSTSRPTSEGRKKRHLPTGPADTASDLRALRSQLSCARLPFPEVKVTDDISVDQPVELVTVSKPPERRFTNH
jgi:hypothetical protein